MSTRVPNQYAEALRPDWAFTYCGPLSMKSRYAVASSRGVKFSRALGCTTTLIALLSPTNHPQVHRLRRRAGLLHPAPSCLLCLLADHPAIDCGSRIVT